MPNFNARRLADLEKLMEQSYVLLDELQTKHSLEQDPVAKGKIRLQIEERQKLISGYETEIKSLNYSIQGQPIRDISRRNGETETGKENGISKPNSPFTVAGRLKNPADFVGRHRARATLLQRCRNGEATSLVGERRIGKTWLMDYVRLVASEELGENYRVAYVDASQHSCSTIAGFVANCLRELQLEAEGNAAELRLNSLEKGVSYLLNQNITPVLCVDEFERFGKTHQHEFDLDFFEGLRGIASMGIAFVTASKIRLIDLVSTNFSTSPFFNIFMTVRVRPFSPEDVQTFIERSITVAGFSELEQAKLRELGKDLPLRLQMVADLINRDRQLSIYRPDDSIYWQEISDELEDMYEGMVIKQ